MDNLFTWLGILFCVSQSAMFSGLNLAFFSLTRLRLEIEVEASENEKAQKVLEMRDDSNFLLTTILWGNVGINVLLTLLSDSVMTGLISFSFSTVIITFFGEIIPQAYFSRNALKMAFILAPVLKLYQVILYPVAKPCALLLDSWLGKETKQFLSEDVIKMFIEKHVEDKGSEIDQIEGVGAINFLDIDEVLIKDEGENLNKDSVIQLSTLDRELIIPAHQPIVTDPFIQKINSSGEKWIIFTDETDSPRLVLDADGFIRSIYNEKPIENFKKFTHVPLVVKDEELDLGLLLKLFKNKGSKFSDRPIERDIALLWNKDYKKIITGADLFGRLLIGI